MNGSLLLDQLGTTASSVVMAVLPLAAIFLAIQVLFLRLPRRDVARIITGTLVAGAGLFLFLLGVGIGFMPAGRMIGEALGAMPQKWLLVPIGILLGFFTTWSEPAVRILADQVEDASNGSILSSMVLYTVCIGVAVWVGLGMLRIVYGLPLLYLLVPGYVLAIAAMWFSRKEFVAIAVDAGGVATGPMANTFLLALALGTSAAMGGQDPMMQGLGLVAMIALAPILSVMTLGLVVRWKEPRKE